MDYEKEILNVLCEAGVEGLSVYKISVHVHNSCNSLFAPVIFDEVHSCVQAWLLRALRNPNPPVSRCERRGYYRLNLEEPSVSQKFFDFDNEPEAGKPASKAAETPMLPFLF